MKISFLIQGFHVAASRYRVIQYLPFFEVHGIKYHVHEFPSGIKKWSNYLKNIKTTDIVFVQRKRLPLYVLFYLRHMGKRIVYDFDDAVMFRNSLAPNPYSRRRQMSFKRMLKFTDMVIAGNNFLKSEAQRYHRDVRILPTPIDGDRYSQKGYREANFVNIGWIGDHGSIHYMDSYRDVWEALGNRYGDRVCLTIICDTFIETKKIKLNRVQWRYDTEIEELKRLDIGVMPLFNDLWSMGKCGYKIIQYMGVGVPAVCTPVGINRDVVEDGINGFWATTKEEWTERLSTLIDDYRLRVNMGIEGRKKIMAHYTVQACAPLLIEWLEGLN
ncbi:MAG TPA: glycosyltransferase family 4 protein [Syntrophorhabdaceae bacterium]|nr:glycosyltransferase family 4 protein [Syntrophorhabdaceae bacterium]